MPPVTLVRFVPAVAAAVLVCACRAFFFVVDELAHIFRVLVPKVLLHLSSITWITLSLLKEAWSKQA
jgi:hypothetical protein